MPTKVLICHDLLIVRDGLARILESEPQIEVIETTDSGVHAMVLAHSRQPDVVVTGLTPHGMSGLELIRRLGSEGLDPVPRVVVFTMNPSDDTVTEALRAGVNGLLTEDASREEVLATIRAAARGQIMLAPSVTQRLVEWFRQQPAQSPALAWPGLASLTPREREVLLLVARGMSTDEIARELYIGISTVRTYLHRLRAKLELRDRAQLVSFAYRAGLVTWPAAGQGDPAVS
jgi:DNA-binding NarL/FixJ family response regulator